MSDLNDKLNDIRKRADRPSPPSHHPFSTLQERVAALLQEKKMKQSHLAAAANLPAVTLCRILRGRRPLKPRHLQALAKALGVTPQWLVDGSDGQFFQVLSYPLVDGEVPAPGPDYFRYLTPITASDPIEAARLGVENSAGAVDQSELRRHGFFVHNMASGQVTQVNGGELVKP